MSGQLGLGRGGKFKPRALTAVAATAGAVALGTGCYQHYRSKPGALESVQR